MWNVWVYPILNVRESSYYIKKKTTKQNQPKKKGREGGNNIKVTENTPSEKLQKHMKL